MIYLGIDLGTSSVKVLAMNENGKIVGQASRDYPLSFPHSGWSEQNPEDWVKGTFLCLSEIFEAVNPKEVKGVSFGGQMHGLVLLDKEDRVIRPAILWNDGRTGEETEYLNKIVGTELLVENTGNICFAGFTAPKILWVQKNEPENFAKISKIMLPKDYLAYVFSGEFSTDFSDASGMLLLDVEKKCWSPLMLKICGIEERMLPKLYESYEKTGTVKQEIAVRFGMETDVTVAAGAGDNAAAAIGTGTFGEGACNLSLGTSGTLFITSKEFRKPANPAIHSFCHADGHYHLMACMLSSASCQKWLMEEIFKREDYNEIQEEIVPKGTELKKSRLGENEVFFLPYLMGERCPHNDTKIRGMFYGMSLDTRQADLVQAVLEGVAFSFKDALKIANDCDVKPARTKICGGGAKSGLWIRILSSVLNLEIDVIDNEQGPGLGACMLAMVAGGGADSLEEIAGKVVKIRETVKPVPELVRKYEKQYEKYRLFYPALKEITG